MLIWMKVIFMKGSLYITSFKLIFFAYILEYFTQRICFFRNILERLDGFCTFGFPELVCEQNIPCSTNTECEIHKHRFSTSYSVCTKGNEFPPECNSECFWVQECVFGKYFGNSHNTVHHYSFIYKYL